MGYVATWCVMSGLASLISRPIFRITPICSSLLSSEYFSSLPPGFSLWAARYVSREAFDKTTINRFVSLSPAAMGTCCSAMSRGSSGGGRDCVPARKCELHYMHGGFCVEGFFSGSRYSDILERFLLVPVSLGLVAMVKGRWESRGEAEDNTRR